MLHAVCRRWWVLLLRGLCAIALGISAIAWPGITLVSLMLVYGAFCLAEGITGIMIGVGSGPQGRVWWPMVLFGLVSVAAGILAIMNPPAMAQALITVLAIVSIVRGVLEISSAIALRKEIDDEWVLILSGALSIAFGGLLLAKPGAGIEAMILLFGFYVTVIGVTAVALSLRLRRLGRKHGDPTAETV
ncbi:HdeD family acid-resistance protein [Planctomicrobium sp. SH664]|uniref:HdeD family acid-resistance protein n=1 Tax=Planctomicrobium sp. SH664 TaxID=3448125 RepID=UPI003F5B4969